MAIDPQANRAMVQGISIPFANLVSTLRSTPGTALGSDGVLQTFPANQARITDRGLLVEQAATNIVLQSQSLNLAPWSASDANTSIFGLAPDATSSAIKLSENTTLTAHYVEQTVSLSVGTEYTASFYVQANSRSRVQLRCDDGADWGRCSFNLATGVAGTPIVGRADITALSAGWFRISVTGTPNTAADSVIQLYLLDDGGNLSYLGDGTSAINVWGAQLEARPFPSSYIATTISITTRATDNIQLSDVSQFGSTYSWLIEGTTPSAWDPGNRFFLDFGPGHILYYPASGGVLKSHTGSAAYDHGSIGVDETFKLALAYDAIGSVSSLNGLVPVTSDGTVFPAMTAIYLGSHSGTGGPWNGYIKSIVGWSGIRKSDVELQALSG